MKQDCIQYGINIKRARFKKKMTQEELAQIVGTSQPVINAYEGNKRGRPSLKLLVSIAYALEVSLDWLITGKEYRER